MVHRVTERGDVRVQFEGVNNRWTFHPDAVKKCHKFEVNDMVCIIHDTNRLRELQEGHGEWLELIGAVCILFIIHIYIQNRKNYK